MPAAIYPGSFDPITNGHLNLIQRGLQMFDRVIVAIASNPKKTPLFSIDERRELIREACNDPRVEIDTFQGLLVEYAKRRGVHVILRGLRAVSDFEYEFQLAGMNRRLAPGVETLFLTPSDKYLFLSATIVREIAVLGGDISAFVHPLTAERMQGKIGRKAG